MVKVVLEDVVKKFGKQIAVDHLNLEVRDKEFLVLLGPSGCGKTTTLNMVAGLIKVDGGHISFDGELVDPLPPEKRDIAMVFQSYALYPHMTARQNIEFPLKVKKVPKDEIKKRLDEVAAMLRISHLIEKKPHELSGGERQRVALARALIRKPRVFLLDEPLSNLDAILRVVARAELKRLQKEIQTTTLYVTHDQVEAMTMADRIALMKDGVLQQLGTPRDIYFTPANSFVGRFVGTPPMNFIDCSYKEQNGKVILDTGTFTLDFTFLAELIKKGATGSELVIGARPQNILLHKKKPPDEAVQSEIYVTEPMGETTVVNIKLGEQLLKAEARQFEGQLGEKIWFTFEKNRIYIFDKKTGKLLT